MSLIAEASHIDLLTTCWIHIYQSKKKSKRPKSHGIDNISIEKFKENLKNDEYLLKKTSEKILNNKYRIRSLFAYLISKENSLEKRLICAPTVSNRIFHKAILFVINKYISQYINTGVSYCGITRHDEDEPYNTKRAILCLINNVENENFWIVKSDIKKFYDNVPRKKFCLAAKKVFQTYLPDSTLNSYLKRIILFKIGNIHTNLLPYLPPKGKGIAQGSPLSQYFANIYLTPFDLSMKKKYQYRFIRYIDDFIVCCKDETEAISALKYAGVQLKKLKLTLNEKKEKTYIRCLKNHSIHFLGLSISRHKITWKKNEKDIKVWLKDILNINNKKYYNDCNSKKEILIRMNNILKGQMNYLKYYHTREIFKLINNKIKKEKNRNHLELLNINKINPIISETNWKKVFK